MKTKYNTTFVHDYVDVNDVDVIDVMDDDTDFPWSDNTTYKFLSINDVVKLFDKLYN